MPARLSREDRVRAAVLAAARRNLSAPEKGPAPVPRGARPKVVLLVEKPPAGGPPIPASGTVTTDGVTRLYVGRDWFPEAGSVAPFAASLLGVDVLEVVGTTRVAGERAKKRLNQAWRLAEVIDSGRLDGAATDSMRAVLARL